MGANTTELGEFIKELERLEVDLDSYYKQAARELAKHMLALVVPRTVVGEYEKYGIKRLGGTLRRGWVSKTHKESFDKTQKGAPCPTSKEMENWANKLKVEVKANTYTIEVENPVEYASFIEYGFIMPNGKYYTPKHMMTISAQQLEGIMPRVLEDELYKWLKKRFDV